MKKNKGLLIFLLGFTSCSSFNMGTPSDKLTIDQFEMVHLEQSREDVHRALGAADKSYVIKSASGNIENGLWIYTLKENQYQRAAISFDIRAKKVIGKTFIPTEQEQEVSLDFLLNTKFQGVSFTEIRPKRCLDYTPMQTLYINVEKGLSIEYNRKDKIVESINWTQPEKLKERTKQIQACQKDYNQMLEEIW